MNRWLTWRARLHHLIHPENACLCHTCAKERQQRFEDGRRYGNPDLPAKKVSEIKWLTRKKT